MTFTNVFGSPRIVDEQGTITREPRETAFEVILSLGLPTRVSWLEFTVEAIFLPFDRESTPELEFETNVMWLPGERTRGWLSSHLDIVDKFSAAERPSDRPCVHSQAESRARYERLAVQLAARGPFAAWVELEGSLDYVATGLPRPGDRAGGMQFLDKASPWLFSIVFVFPVAPL